MLQILNYKYLNTYFEIILVAINDALVKKYLDNEISYISMQKSMIKLLKKPYFKKYYIRKPKNISDIKFMVKMVNKYLDNYLKNS